mmetsp:Transcript_18781/g.24387  ORF Transcript_18781/g.24387 Transcript_18781/m.24387 type:complete len:489 (+) Transcript_18781:383-1849(+)
MKSMQNFSAWCLFNAGYCELTTGFQASSPNVIRGKTAFHNVIATLSATLAEDHDLSSLQKSSNNGRTRRTRISDGTGNIHIEVSKDVIPTKKRRKSRSKPRVKSDTKKINIFQDNVEILDNRDNNGVAFASREERRHTSFEEECELANKVKEYASIVVVREALEARLNREPHEYEWAMEVYGANVADVGEKENQRRAEMIETLQNIVAEGQEAQSKLVSSHIGLVINIAKKYQGQGLQLSDLVQEGTLGLIEAIKKFEPSKGFRFTTYARWWVRHYVGRSIADSSRVIRLPAHVHSMIQKTEKLKRDFLKMSGREPTVPEIAHELKIPVEKLQLYTKSSSRVLSLEMPLNAKPNGDDKRTIMDTIQSDSPSPEDHLEHASLRKDIFAVIDELNVQEREVLINRFGLDDHIPKTIDEVSTKMNISRDRVRTIEARALNRLRHPLRNYRLKDYVGGNDQTGADAFDFNDDIFRSVYSGSNGPSSPEFWSR